MNPFDLSGPEFLIVYASIAAIVSLAHFAYRELTETGEVTRADISDPYLIAYLRNGELEVLRVATLSLVDRELIALGGPTVFSDKEVTFATSRPGNPRTRGRAAALPQADRSEVDVSR